MEKTTRQTSTLAKRAVIVTTLLACLFALLSIFFRTSYGEKAITGSLSKVLSAYLGAEVTIEHALIDFPNKIKLRHVVVESEDRIPIFRSSDVTIHINNIPLFENLITNNSSLGSLNVEKLSLTNATFYAKKTTGKSYNFSSLIENLVDTTSATFISPSQFICNNISLKNVDVLYEDSLGSSILSIKGLDYDGALTKKGDVVTINTNQFRLQAQEGSSSAIKMKGRLYMNIFLGQSMLTSFSIQTNDHSLLQGNINVDVSKVGESKPTSIYQSPISGNAEFLTINVDSSFLKKDARIAVKLGGTLANLKIAKWVAKIGDSFAEGGANIQDIFSSPKISTISITKSNLVISDIEHILVSFYKSNSDSLLRSLKPYLNIKELSLTGRYHRVTPSKFHLSLNSSSSTFRNLKFSGYHIPKKHTLEGKVELYNFNTKPLFKNHPFFSSINFNGDILLSPNETQVAKISGSMPPSRILKSTLSSPYLDISLQKNKADVSGEFTINSVSFSTDGNLLWDSTKEVSYTFTGLLKASTLNQRLQYKIFTPHKNFHYKVHGNLISSKEKGFIQTTIAEDSLFTSSKVKINLYQPSPANFENDKSRLEIASNNTDIVLSGKFNTSSLTTFFQRTVQSLSSEYRKNFFFLINQDDDLTKKITLSDTYASIYIQRRSSPWTSFFLPDISGDITIDGSFSSSRNNIDINLLISTDSISIAKNLYLKQAASYLHYSEKETEEDNPLEKEISLQLTTKKISFSNTSLRDVEWTLNYKNEKSKNVIRFYIDQIKASANLEFSTTPLLNKLSILFQTASFSFGSFSWELSNRTPIMIGTNSLRTNLFSLKNKTQSMTLQGDLSEASQEGLRISLSNISIREVSSLFPRSLNFPIEGRLNATWKIKGGFSNLEGVSTASLSKLGYRNISIPTLLCQSVYKDQAISFTLEGKMADPESNKTLEKFEGRGYLPLSTLWQDLGTNPRSEFASFVFKVPDMPASSLAPYTEKLENIKGTLSIAGSMNGFLDSLSYLIDIEAQNVSAHVPFIGETYVLDGNVSLTKKAITVNEAIISDSQNGKLDLKGSIGLSKMTVSDYNLHASLKNMMLFNNKEERYATFYGTISGSSDYLQLKGPAISPILEGKVSLDKMDLSLLKVSLSTQSKLFKSKTPFIKIVKRDSSIKGSYANMFLNANSFSLANSTSHVKHSRYRFLQNVQLDIELESDNNATFRLIFDKRLGHEFLASIGNLSINVQRKEDVILNGTAEIASGSYSLYATKLFLVPGGSIQWASSPIGKGEFFDVLASRSYTQSYISSSNDENEAQDTKVEVEVFAKLTNQIDEPRLEMGYSTTSENFQGVQYYKALGSSLPGLEDPNAEMAALGFLLMGQWVTPSPYYLPQSSPNSTQAATLNTISSGFSNLLLNQFSRIFGGFSWIRTFKLGLNSQSLSQVGIDFSLSLYFPGLDNKFSFTVENRNASGLSSSIKAKNEQRLEYNLSNKVSVNIFHSNESLLGLFHNANIDFWGFGLSYKEKFDSFSGLFSKIGKSITRIFTSPVVSSKKELEKENPIKKEDQSKTNKVNARPTSLPSSSSSPNTYPQ